MGGATVRLNPHRQRLAGRLRDLRAATGLSGNRFAARISWTQSKVSRLETGKQIPNDADLDAWTRATNASEEQVQELLDLRTLARVEYATWRDVATRGEGGLAGRQADYAEQEQQVSRFAEYQPGMIPGIVQTAAYARELLMLPGGPLSAGASPADVEALIGQRVRRQEILYQPSRLIQVLVGEAALYAAPGARDTMVDQLHRLIDYAGLVAVEVAVLPLRTLAVMPLTSFVIYDGDCVTVETLTGEYQLTEPVEVAVYRQAFDVLRDSAVKGPDAVALIQRVAAKLRG